MVNFKKTLVITLVFLMVSAMIVPLINAATITPNASIYCYPSEQTAVLTGADFAANSIVTIHIIILENDSYQFSDTIISDGTGAFIYNYQLTGIELTYLVTAIDEAGNTAQTTFLDAQPTRVNFATSGLPAGTSVTVNWNATNPGNNEIYGPTTFLSPGPVAAATVKPLTNMNFSFPSSITTGGTTYSLSSTNATSPFTTGATGTTNTITATYAVAITKYQVTFKQAGLDGTTDAGTVLTVNGTNVPYTGFDYNILVNSGDRLVYTYNSTVASTTPGKQFVLTNTSPSSPLVSISSNQTVTGTYKTQYNVTVSTSGLGTHVTNVLNGTTVLGTATDATPFSIWVDSGSSLDLNIVSPITDGTTQFNFTIWSGAISGATRPYSFASITSAITVTANYKAGYQVTFDASSNVKGDSATVIVTVNGTTLIASSLPYSVWVASGDVVSYVFSSPVASSSAPNTMRYVWSSTSGLGQTLQSNDFTVTAAGAVNGTYKTQYNVTFAQSGVGTDFNGTVMTVNSTAYDRAGVSFWADAGDKYVFTYASPLNANASKQYILTNLNESSPLTVSAATTVTGTYAKAELTYTGDLSGQYSDLVTVSAILTNSSGSISGVKVTFTIGTQSNSSLTNSSGIATATIILNQPAGNYKVKASCAGASGTTLIDEEDFTISRECVAITYTGDTSVITAGPLITNATVQLSASLVQQADGYPGNLSLAKVTFILSPASGSDIIFTNIPVSASGVAVKIASIPAGEYAIEVVISDGNLYWKQCPYGDGVLHVALGTNVLRVTGGGWIPDNKSTNGKDNFGFTVYYNKNSAPKGQFVFIIHGQDGYNYIIKGNSWAKGGLSFSGSDNAFFSGKCNIKQIDKETGDVVNTLGGYTFAVNIKDGDIASPQNGRADVFAITILDPSGNIWGQIGTAANLITLGGGNIIIKSK
ncbi:MAG TPA: hypothetical protein VLH35_00125 [Candidatus Acidoferrales bacterium]|nr:hypothetical protein [Candidatus Acidoferrales bacterium]